MLLLKFLGLVVIAVFAYSAGAVLGGRSRAGWSATVVPGLADLGLSLGLLLAALALAVSDLHGWRVTLAWVGLALLLGIAVHVVQPHVCEQKPLPQ